VEFEHPARQLAVDWQTQPPWPVGQLHTDGALGAMEDFTQVPPAASQFGWVVVATHAEKRLRSCSSPQGPASDPAGVGVVEPHDASVSVRSTRLKRDMTTLRSLRIP